MAATDEAFVKLKQYLTEIQRHAEGRRALHVRISRLERHFHEAHYRRTIAALLRPLVEKHGAVMHPLPNTDLIVITGTATVEDILTPLSKVYQEFQKSAALSGLSAKAGVSDSFATWYDLKDDLEKLSKDVELLSAGAAPAVPTSPTGTAKSTANSGGGSGSSGRVSSKPGIKYVDIAAPKKDVKHREFDPEMLVALTGALKTADVSTFIRKQKVVAVVAGHGSVPVMVHRTVPMSVVFDHLLRETKLTPNAWLNGYISDLLARRVLRSEPNMHEDNSLASSISVTVSAILSDAFEAFERAQGPSFVRSKIVLELSVYDLLANSDSFLTAKQKIRELGYKYCISGINLVSFGWVSKELLDADFVKISYPPDLDAGWFDDKRLLILRTRFKDIGIAKFILNECTQTSMIEMGQSLGITMFQGDAVVG
jgi:hypothetical protein